MMRLARVLGVSMVPLATTAAMGAPGDTLVVTGEVVNVRAGPGSRNPVLFHAYRDQEAVELTRTGNWIQVQIPDRAEDGWIHQSLLQVMERAQPATLEPPGTAPGAQPGTSGRVSALLPVEERAAPSSPTTQARLTGALARFRSSVNEFNARAVAAAGVELFTGAEEVDGGTVRVLVTDAWSWVPEAGQTSYTNALFDHWRAAMGGSGPVRVEVVDPSGKVVSEKSGPGTP